MNLPSRHPAIASLLLAALLVHAPATAGRAPASGARSGLETAALAAQSWAADAQLVYLENDEDLDEAGASPRWGYVFHSASLGTSRLYSVKQGRVRVAANLDVKLEAPPVTPQWIDSGDARTAAEREAARELRETADAELATMLLMRGAFDEKHPDRTTWMLVWNSPGRPSLYVVVDATDGSLVRTWRG